MEGGGLHNSQGGQRPVSMGMQQPGVGVRSMAVQQGAAYSPPQQPLQASPQNVQRLAGVRHSYQGPPPQGDHDKLVSELMHEVETKRSELENMTMSVVQWKQSFKDKLHQEKMELQASRMTMQERMSLRMLQLHGRLLAAVAFQKLREHRKQVLWLQRVKELKGQCEALREEANIAAANSMSASQDFSQQEFAQRVLNSLSHLLSIAQGQDLEGEGWIMSDIVSVGNAVVGEKFRQLLNVIQQVKSNESSLQRRTADLMQGNSVVAQLQERIDSLERDVHQKRKAVESLSMQVFPPPFTRPGRSACGCLPRLSAVSLLLAECVHVLQLDMERESSARDSRRSSPRASSSASKESMHSEFLGKEVQSLTEVKARLDDENHALKRKVMDLEDSNDALRKQLVDARRCCSLPLAVALSVNTIFLGARVLICEKYCREMDITGVDRRSMHALEQDQRKDAETIKALSGLRENAERKAQALQDELRSQGAEVMKLKKELQEARARSQMAGGTPDIGGTYGNAQANDLLQLIQLRAAAEKRAEEAEASLKLEQHNVWKLKQELKMLEFRLSESGTRKSESSANSPKFQPRDSQNSTMSLASTSPSSFEMQRMQRELKVMAELKEAALQSLDSLRSELVDGVTNIEFSNLRIDSKIGSGSFAEVYRGEWTRPCAIKKLRGLTKRRQLQDFYREAQILQMLNHAGVVQLMGICMNIPELYLVTELVVGGSLEGRTFTTS